MIINQTHEYGKDVYSFEANATKYTVMTHGNNTYEVWSQRKSGSFFPTVNIMTIEEMAKRSKAFRNLIALINADCENGVAV